MDSGAVQRIQVTLDEVLEEKNIQASLEHLLEKNNNGCGSDGIRVSQFAEYWSINRMQILQQLQNGEYIPDIVLEQERISLSGKRRIVSMFTCIDRLLLRAVAQIIQPHCEKIFSDHSHAYRYGYGTGTAVEMAVNYINGGCHWVAEIDIENFFDSIPINQLEQRIKEYFVLDERLENLLELYFHCRLERNGRIETKQAGVVQGSPLSPILSNLYLHPLDQFLEGCGYHFVRFADDINIYTQKDEEASEAMKAAVDYIHSLGLFVNETKQGIYEGHRRYFLGYRFEKRGNRYIATNKKIKDNYYHNWHKSAIQKVEKSYHLVNDGILSKRDFTVLFESEKGKRFIPVETTDALNVYSEVIFTSNFFDFISKHRLRVTIFDKYGNGLGTYTGCRYGSLGKTMLKQAAIYLDANRRLILAKRLMMAAMHNIRANIRYYYKQKKTDALAQGITHLSDAIAKMNEAPTVEMLMLIEARARQAYYDVYNEIISQESFYYHQRTRRPPKDALNALISFGNTYLYNRIATEIRKTSLDIRMGIVHSTTNRDESLNLDIAEIFKPLIVDRVIFTMINRKMIDATAHFEEVDNGGIYLNQSGKRIFLEALERKIHAKSNVGQQTVSNDTLMKKEITKILRVVLYDETYKPYKYST